MFRDGGLCIRPVPDSHCVRTFTAAAAGYVVGQCVQRGRQSSRDVLAQTTALLARYIDHPRADLCLAGLAALGEIGSRGSLPLPDGASERVGMLCLLWVLLAGIVLLAAASVYARLA